MSSSSSIASAMDMIPSVPHAPPGYFAVVMCADCHVFGLGDAMVIVYDRQQHTAAVLCEPCAQQCGATGRGEPREHDGA